MPPPTFSEIKFVTLGVADLDRSIAFYADAFGFVEIARTRVDHEALGDLWRIPHGIAGRFVILGIPGIESGMLRLVEWTPSGDHVWAPPVKLQDLGPFAVNFRVREIHAAWDSLARAGARPKSPPKYWEVNGDDYFNAADFDADNEGKPNIMCTEPRSESGLTWRCTLMSSKNATLRRPGRLNHPGLVSSA